MIKSPKYVVMAGMVRSKEDGDLHYVSTLKLCSLYGVDPKDCLLISSKTDIRGMRIPPKLPTLTARYDGDYSLERFK